MPVSDSYHDSLIESLKDSHYAAVYLETHLEGDEYGFESELLRLAFNHVLEALGPQNLTPEQIKIQAQQLEEIMQKPAPEAINQLTSWLQALGLKLTIKIAPKMPEINHENDAVSSIKITV
ncbi:MAG: hypothetical protein IM466_03910 [Microcystis sp. M04BS1]|uniref:Uncharacterized protein n=1 Tax=Microcystis aeruginosa Ma_MB_S_20031200_S102 TaxID=2486254 RepID=A0A552F4K5_MICAE|nr:hypothetical protein [Microcystis sp. M04BS1]TRU22187.1 MAG: hypothetical protein EWV79_14525 [Microcystis aeruginosa Ma_MB_S_20031200_S102D]TRU41634.1 MAG: hypothetical protein EWV92_03005 [Microcystis aeruginosa Ma_MB_S_20031200_S102]